MTDCQRWAIGARVLTPELGAGTVEELDLEPYGTRVRHDAWDGGPSCCSTWYTGTQLAPLPAGFVARQPTPEERARAAQLMAAITDAIADAGWYA